MRFGGTKSNICYSVGLAMATSVALVPALPATAATVGEILACYACNFNDPPGATGNTAIDNALTNNPSVAADGILFAFVNTSSTSIVGGTFSVSGVGTVTDSFALPTIAANSTYILLPGLSNDGGVHLSGGLFANVGFTQDTSDGQGNVNDSSAFSFTGLSSLLAVTSGVFHPGDAALILPWRDNPNASTSFIGQGPDGDGCNNCYFGQIATLSTPDVTATPLPAALPLFASGLAGLGWISRRRKRRAA
jgi:hypothetical protein